MDYAIDVIYLDFVEFLDHWVLVFIKLGYFSAIVSSNIFFCPSLSHPV